MEYSDLLNDFLDGTLDSSQEETLFSALSSNEDLRWEFKHLLAISGAVHNDDEAFTPPTESTRRIFAELGFATPLGDGSVIATGASGFLLGLKQYLPAILTGIVSSALTAGAFFFTQNDRPQDTAALAARPAAIRTAPHLERALSKMYTGEHTSSDSHSVQSGSIALQPTVRYIYINKPVQDIPVHQADIPPSDVSEDQIPRQSIQFAQASMDETPLVHSTSSRSEFRSVKTPVAQQNFSFSASSLPEISVEFRGITSVSFPVATLPPSNNPWFNNKAANILVALDEHQSAGIEFGQETYFQRFEGKDARGIRFQYEQNPVLPWLGVAYRYSLPSLGLFYPFGQLTLAGAPVGAMGRSMLGINYAPGSRIRLSAGFEGSYLWYQVQNKWYSSSNLGISYGVSVSF